MSGHLALPHSSSALLDARTSEFNLLRQATTA